MERSSPSGDTAVPGSVAGAGDHPLSSQASGCAQRGGGGAAARNRTRPQVQAALGVAYGASLRVSEVAHLKVDDADSTRMLLRVYQQGKGRKDRNAMLSPLLLELLRLWWRKGSLMALMEGKTPPG